MGFFSTLFGVTSASVNNLAPGRGWTIDIVGESSYQDNLKRQYRKNGGNGHDLKVVAVLYPEESNPHDANAVRVDIGGDTVGYLSRDLAAEYRECLKTKAGQCSAKIVGGFVMDDGSTASYGAKLKVAWPPRMK